MSYSSYHFVYENCASYTYYYIIIYVAVYLSLSAELHLQYAHGQ